MIRLDIKTNFSCNNRCRFCSQGNKRNMYADRTAKEIQKALRKARKNCDEVVFTGGEPTIRKDIIELVGFARKLKYKVIQMQSNGRMFHYGEFCDDLIGAGVTEFSVSVHGHNAELHDYLTCSKGCFSQVISGIENLKARNQAVMTNTVITKPNYRFLPDIARLLASLRVKQFQLSFVYPVGRAEENFESIVPKMSLTAPYIKKGLDIGIEAGIRVMSECVPYCIMDGYENYIAEEVIPIAKVDAADEIIDNFTEFRRKVIRSKGPECPKCIYYDSCECTCRGYTEHFGWNEFRPIKKIKRPKALKCPPYLRKSVFYS